MRKILSLLFVAVFALSLMMCGAPASVSAQTVSTQASAMDEMPLFVVDEQVVLPGETFIVPVRIENNPGLVSLKLSLQYDDTVLELVSAEEQDFSTVSYGPTEKVPFVINWLDTIHPDNTTNGVITNLTFRVKESVSAVSTLLQISYDSEDVYNAAWESVGFSTQSAYIHVVEYRVGDVNEDGNVNNRDLGLLLRHTNSWEVTLNLAAADVNGDGNVNNRDLGLLQRYLNGWDVELVQPLPEEPENTNELLSQVPDELNGTKIKMLIWWNTSTTDKEYAETFKQETGIQVAYETAAIDKYQSSLTGKIMAGNPPAVAAIINEWYPQPITRGLMQPIKNTGWDYTDPIYATNLMDQFAYKGEHYGIALKGSNMTTFEVMFFNKKLLKANGVSQDPYQLWKKGQWNWETCLDIAQKCTNAKKETYGLTLIYQNYWMLSAGQDFVLSDQNGLKNNIKSSALLNSWYHAWDMIYTHKVIPTMFSQQQQMFYNGTVAMMGGGSYFMQAGANYSNYVPQNMTDDWGVVPFPSPKGQNAVVACEGTVWGFPTKVSGKQLQAAMWFLRYYLDDATYGDRDFYPTEECWEIMDWMWNQKIQSYNSVGVVTYGGKQSAYAIQYSLIDDATTKAQVASNLDSWYVELQININQIEAEMT